MGDAPQRCRASDRGSVAVEAALVVSLLLTPFFLGVLYYGQYFWKAQRVGTLDVAIPQGQLAGSYCGTDVLLSRVKELLVGNLSVLGDQLGVPVAASDVTVSVVRILPDLGVDLNVAVSVPVVDEIAGLLPLPNNGAVVKDLTTRLSNVSVNLTSC